MTPEQLAKSGTEHAEQSALFCWAAACEYKEQLRWMHAIPNAGHRGNKVAASQLKAEGVKAGVADIFLPVVRWQPGTINLMQYAGLYIEMKRLNGKPSDVTADQSAFKVHCDQNRYAWAVCFGWMAARDVIVWYFNGK